MKYLFFLLLLIPVITPAFALTYTTSNPNEDGYIDTTLAAGAACPGAPYAETSGGAFLNNEVASNAAGSGCSRGYIEWDISGIPQYALITDVDIQFEVTSVASARNCSIYDMMFRPTLQTAATIWNDAGNGTAFVTNDSTCTTAGINKNIDLGTDAETRIYNLLTADWFGIGIKIHNETRDALSHNSRWNSEESASTPDPTLVVTYTFTPPNAVTPLTATDIRPTAVDLSWSQPSLNGGTLLGYQINMTTPWSGNVATVARNFTGSSATTATVTGLTGSTPYTFRVSAITLGGGLNTTGGFKVNVTTDFDPTGSFSPGTFSTNFTGTDVRTIKYERDDINSTALWLNVTYPNTYNTTCNFYYKFALANDTYTNLSDVAVNTNEDEASFLFNHVDNEVIDVLCWDDATEDEARYLITQSAFPFLEQIDNFRNGTYGTAGMFGAIDFITLSAVIVSMIGFNRVNESVGIIFGLFMIGALAILSNGEIISWASTFTVGFAVLIMWAIGTTRKD